jgi:hypothetical protein
MTREERAYNYASKKNPTKFTVGEIAKHYDDGYQDAISKACEWLEDNVTKNGVFSNLMFKKEDIQYFRKALEEE